MNQAELFGKYEPKSSNIKLNNIESIKSKNAQSSIRKYLKSNKDRVVVGGSVAQTGQIKVGRKLGDMDLYVEGGLSPSKAAKNSMKQLKEGGVKRVSQVKGQVTIEGKKAVEFHDISRLNTNIEQVIPSWQSPNKYIIQTPEGIRIQRIGLQARRKLVAAFADPRRIRIGKYKKDLKDFKVIADKIFRNAERKSRQAFFFRGKKIKAVERIFGKKISRKPLKVKRVKVVKKKVIKKRIKKKPKKKAKKKPIKKLKKRVIKKKIIKKKVVRKRKKKRPSQRRVKPKKPKRIKFIPSQPKRKPKRPRRIPPSQKPRKPPRKPRRMLPKRPLRQPPSQPPRKLKKRPTRMPPKIITKKPKIIKPSKKPPVIIPLLKKKIIRKKGKKIISYDVFARPLKKSKKAKIPKLIRVNKVPLTKKKAEDLRNYIIDTSLARTGKIKPVKGKIGKPRLKVPISYAAQTQFKFRTYRKVKGRRKPLKPGKVIEKRKRLLDTIQEKRKITLKRRISQIDKGPVKRKKTKRSKKRKPIKRRRTSGGIFS